MAQHNARDDTLTLESAATTAAVEARGFKPTSKRLREHSTCPTHSVELFKLRIGWSGEEGNRYLGLLTANDLKYDPRRKSASITIAYPGEPRRGRQVEKEKATRNTGHTVEHEEQPLNTVRQSPTTIKETQGARTDEDAGNEKPPYIVAGRPQ
jgi:hypothetical protein